jgi:hypothetical protein
MLGNSKSSILNNIVFEIVKGSIKSAILNVLLNKIFPKVISLYKYLGTITSLSSYCIIFIYMIVAVVILFILYKIFAFFQSNKKSTKVLNCTLSSILSKSSDYDLNPHKMEKKKKNKSSKSKIMLTTDIISS